MMRYIIDAGQSDNVMSTSREYLFKVLVIGEISSGKTSFVKRHVYKLFSSQYRLTIGVDFALKVIKWSENKLLRVQLWDIAGQERFGSMTRVYYKEAVGAMIVCDVTRRQTLDAVPKWKRDLDTKVTFPDGSRIPCILLVNKCDLPKEEWSSDKKFLDRFCQENGIDSWFYTSAKDDVNIEAAAKYLYTLIMQKLSALESGLQMTDSITIDQVQSKPPRRFCSC